MTATTPGQSHPRAGQSHPRVGLKHALEGAGVSADNPPVETPTLLYTISQIEAGNPAAEDVEPLRQIVRWMHEYLCQPHPDLGRSGPVCPFMPIALRRNTLYLTSVRLGDETSFETVEAIASQYRDIFLQLDPRDGEESINKALLMLFPDIAETAVPELIDGVQRSLKPQFTRCGLMLGEFHANNQTPGLRSDKIRPLRSPIPMLVIRHMVDSDLPFLHRPLDAAGARVGFLRAYLRRLGGKVSDQKLDRAIDALVDAEIELRGLAPNQLPPAATPSEPPTAS